MPLNDTERQVILSDETERLDGGQIILRALGAEKSLVQRFTGRGFQPEAAIAQRVLQENIQGKRVLVVPCYSINGFIFKELGAAEVIGVDADPRSLAWFKGLQAHYNNNDIGKLFMSLGEYPDFDAYIRHLSGRGSGSEQKAIADVRARVQAALRGNIEPNPIQGITFKQGRLGEVAEEGDAISELIQRGEGFDLIYCPYIFGQENGIRSEEKTSLALDQIWQLSKNGAVVIITPLAIDCSQYEALIEGGKFREVARISEFDEVSVFLEVSK